MATGMNSDGRGAAAQMIAAALSSGATALDESRSKALFRVYGIPVPGSETVETQAAAVAAAARLGDRVVMKGIATDVHLKTDGPVILRLERQ